MHICNMVQVKLPMKNKKRRNKEYSCLDILKNSVHYAMLKEWNWKWDSFCDSDELAWNFKFGTF